jgi:hypothetical protein
MSESGTRAKNGVPWNGKCIDAGVLIVGKHLHYVCCVLCTENKINTFFFAQQNYDFESILWCF